MNFDKLNSHNRQAQLPEGDAQSLPKGWEIKKLGEVCDFQNGFAFKSKTYKETGLPILRITNIQNQNLEIDDLVYFDTKDYKENFERFKVFKGDLVVAMSGATTGKLGINNSDTVFYLNQRVGKFIPKKIIDKSFLYFFLSTKVEESLRIAAGAAQPNLSTKQINDFGIPFPPLPEQQRIVAILDEAFAVIERSRNNAQQNLQNAKELFESYLQGVFDPSTRSGQEGEGWEEKKLNEIGIAQTGTTPKTSEKENFGDFIPFIKPADVDFSGNGNIRYDNDGLSEIGLKKGRKMENGSTLMVCIGATIGKVGFAEMEVSCNQQINSLTVKKDFEPKFIYYAMTSKNFQERVLLEGKGAQATLPIINKSKWENLTISFPKSLKTQQAIVKKLDALSAETKKLEGIYQQKINDLEELKKSILQKAFSGELKGKEMVE
jgi:type I restriction enzyme S subunit